MTASSRASDLAQFRERLAQLNSELFLTVKERRNLCIKIQGLKSSAGTYGAYDPDREKELFSVMQEQFKELSLKELLAFSLVMEDQAMAMAPGSYPSWSQHVHLNGPSHELVAMINPLLLKQRSPELFKKLTLSPEFNFLKDF
jgi:chorismate mutase